MHVIINIHRNSFVVYIIPFYLCTFAMHGRVMLSKLVLDLSLSIPQLKMVCKMLLKNIRKLTYIINEDSKSITSHRNFDL